MEASFASHRVYERTSTQYGWDSVLGVCRRRVEEGGRVHDSQHVKTVFEPCESRSGRAEQLARGRGPVTSRGPRCRACPRPHQTSHSSEAEAWAPKLTWGWLAGFRKFLVIVQPPTHVVYLAEALILQSPQPFTSQHSSSITR